MRGEICQWYQDKGYGFIRPELTRTHRYFFDASSVSGENQAIQIGETVHFELVKGDNGKPQAVNVILPPVIRTKVLVLQVLLFAVLPLGVISFIVKNTPSLIVMYSTMSFLTYWVYLQDKRQALNDMPRIAGWKLHLLALLGGWPGALCAQQVLRHKTRNMGFVFVFWFIVLIHLILLLDQALH